jgi:hypothetical protein
MAIIKDMKSKFGLDLTYHRITAFSINYVTKKAVICVASYVSKEIRATHHAPVEEVDIEIPLTDFDLFQNANPIRQGYIWLKENVVGFEEAQDDMDVVETPEQPTEKQTDGIQ